MANYFIYILRMIVAWCALSYIATKGLPGILISSFIGALVYAEYGREIDKK